MVAAFGWVGTSITMAIQLDASVITLEKPLQWIYRILALLWIGKGFLGWMVLASIQNDGIHLLSNERLISFFSIIVLPVLDVVAGVSLWISWRWGSGVWACVAFSFVGVEMFNQDPVHSLGPAILTSILFLAHLARLTLLWVKSESQIKIV